MQKLDDPTSLMGMTESVFINLTPGERALAMQQTQLLLEVVFEELYSLEAQARLKLDEGPLILPHVDDPDEAIAVFQSHYSLLPFRRALLTNNIRQIYQTWLSRESNLEDRIETIKGLFAYVAWLKAYPRRRQRNGEG